MKNSYINQIELLKQLDSFNSDIEGILEKVSEEVRGDLLEDAKKYIESRNKYYELRAKNELDDILLRSIKIELKNIKEGCLFKTNYLKPKSSGLEINTYDVIRILNKNKSELVVVSCNCGVNCYWMKPSNSDLGKLPSIDKLTKELSNKIGYDDKRKTRYAAKTILNNVAEKGFSRYDDNYFLEKERCWNGKSEYEVVKVDADRGRKLIKDVMKITGLLPGKLNNEPIIIYHPEIIKQLQFK